MSAFEKWIDRVYAETDVGRSVATSLAGLVGLGVYLFRGDWVIAAFASVIMFPVARLAASAIHHRFAGDTVQAAHRQWAERTYNALSDEELKAVDVFVKAGACVLTWRQFNRSDASGNALESLMRRDALTASIMADGGSESFVLDTDLFDVALKAAKVAERAQPRHASQS